MYFRRLFSANKTKLVYSNGLSQVHLSSPFSDGGNRTVYTTCLKLTIETQKSTGCRKNVSQQVLSKDNSKSLISKKQKKLILLLELFNKLKQILNIIKTTLITSLSRLHIWKQHEVPEIKQKRNFKYQHNKIRSSK